MTLRVVFHHRLRHLVFLALATLCFGLGGALRAQETTAYKLGAGDKIHVIVFNEPDLTGDYDVGGQGEIALPLIGQVKVGGLTIDQAENLVTQKYGKDYLINPRVSIQVLNYRPFFILGEVQKPGSYPYVSGMTVLNAVALAGGYTSRADKSDIVITRANDLNGGEKRVKEDTPVLPGDVVRITERFF